MFRRTHIRSKLAVALAVPLAALVGIAGFEVYTAAADVTDTRAQADLATSSIGPGSLVIRLQDERNRAAIDLIGLGGSAGLPVATNAEARGLTDPAIAELQGQLSGRGDEVSAAFAPAFEALGDLDDLRADIDAYTGPMDLTNDELADEVFSRYTTMVESFFDATSSVALAVDDAALRNGVEIVDAAARGSEMRARIVRSVVLAMVTGTTTSPAVTQEVAALYDRGKGFDDDIRTNATGPYAQVADRTFSEPGVQSFNRQVEAFLAGQDASIAELLGAVKSVPDTGYIGLRSRAASVLGAQADRIEEAAATRQKTFAGIALGTLLLALIATGLATRSITRPLRSLQAQAEEMAGASLPAAVRQILDTPPGDDVEMPEVTPIVVKSRDEVAKVAAALSAVQASAVDLAVEQAVLRRNIADSYINLGRRNQNLLTRQLDFITDLERNESDPDTLEGLFRLDHLATRMRRNAESLLVLAGVETSRQWSLPVKLSDVVRAALGEVEDYQRVVVRHLEPAAITGAVAADVAHVLAELIENALSFSPPEQSVEVKGRLTTTGYTVAVTDNGLGMPEDELMRANLRLAGRESFTVAPSRYLGHYVAGHLASRLGVVVELQDSPAGGITARIDVPMGLLANEETDPHLVAATRSAAPASLLPPPPPPSASSDDRAPRHAAAPAASESVSSDSTAAPSHTASGLPRRSDRAAVPADSDSSAPRHTVAASSSSAIEAPHSDGAPLAAADDLPDRRESSDRVASSEADPSALSSSSASVRGFGGLAVSRPMGESLYSVAAGLARGPEPVAPPPEEVDGSDHPAPAPVVTTPSGLARRVPGAQRPDVSVGHASPVVEEATVARSTPEDVYSFLSSFQSGVARGRADAAVDGDAGSPSERPSENPGESMEEGR